MIVVAIIGILAAVAIPGFMKYIKDSKTTEAKTNIKAITEGATSFFQQEHAKDSSGTGFFTHQYPNSAHCRSIASANGSCGTGVANQPTAIQAVGAKTKGDFSAEPWISLNVSITGPVYYSYGYAGAASTDSAGSEFTAQAAAKLDNSAAVDSCFRVQGKVNAAGDPEFGAIVDLSEASTKCTVLSAVISSAATTNP